MDNVVKSVRELARQLGVNHATVLKAKKTGRIRELPEGGFDVDQVRADWVANTKRGRLSAVTAAAREAHAAAGDEGRGVEQVPVPADATAAVTSTLAAHGSPVEGLPTLRDAQTAHEILKARRAQLDCDRLVGKLVEREKAHDVLATFERVTRDAWLVWPAAVAPVVASAFGLADLALVERVLTEHVRAHLGVLAQVPAPDDLLPVAT